MPQLRLEALLLLELLLILPQLNREVCLVELLHVLLLLVLVLLVLVVLLHHQLWPQLRFVFSSSSWPLELALSPERTLPLPVELALSPELSLSSASLFSTCRDYRNCGRGLGRVGYRRRRHRNCGP